MGETAPFWRFSAASYPDLEDSMPVNSVKKPTKIVFTSDSNSSSGVLSFCRL